MKFWNLFFKAGLANGFGKKKKGNTISDSLSLYFRFITWSMVLEFLNIEFDFVHYKAIPTRNVQHYLRAAIGITFLVCWYILSEMSAVTCLAFFNLEISPLSKGCWHCPVSSRKRVNLRRWRGQIVIFLISAFTTPHLPAWFSISLYSGKCWSLCEAEVLVPPAPTLTKRWVTSRSRDAKGRLTAGSHNFELSRAPQRSSLLQKEHRIDDIVFTTSVVQFYILPRTAKRYWSWEFIINAIK